MSLGTVKGISCWIAWALAVAFGSALAAERERVEEKVGDIDVERWIEDTVRVSRDWRRIAWSTRDETVVVDGATGPVYSGITRPVQFDPSGRRFFYVARKVDRWFVVLDGVAGPERREVTQAGFDDGGGRFAAIERLSPSKCALVVEGKEVAKHEEIKTFTFGPSGAGLAYTARERDKEFAVVDGKKGKRYDMAGPVHFSPDGAHWAHAARRGEKRFLVLDGEEQQPVQRILPAPVFFSARGGHVAYSAVEFEGEKPRWFVIVDAKKLGPYDGVSFEAFRFSPDGSRYAFPVVHGADWFVVLDGEEGLRFDTIVNSTPLFSPDGKRVAYGGKRRDQFWLWLDGELHKQPFDELAGNFFRFTKDAKRFDYAARRGIEYALYAGGRRHPVFNILYRPTYSDDDEHMAYVADFGKVQCVVLDGKEIGRYEATRCSHAEITPDGKHVVFGARRGKEWFVCVDGDPGPACDWIFASPEGRVCAIEGTTLRTLVRRGNAVYRVEETLP